MTIPEASASLFQFIIYLLGAVSLVFLGIWLSEYGLPADHIGIIKLGSHAVLSGIEHDDWAAR
ncbi:MAG: hypothetical protein MO846_02530 [Candidatus Devosia symbiotica]|nr:hypothetical protein [Candidatus Devosia symbiotica]